MTYQLEDPTFDVELVAGSVKVAMKEAGAASSDLWKVPRNQIHVIPGFNVRNEDDPAYQAHIRSIADSIKENGFYQHKPLAGFVSKVNGVDIINLTDGHTRLAAVDIAVAEGAEISVLPVVISPRGTSMEDLTVSLYTSNTGKPLTPYETANLCKRLIGFGTTEAEIAKRLGLSKKYVEDLLNLVASPRSVRELVSTGRVSATTAMKAIREYGENASKELQKAVDTAEAAGKTRATARTLKPRVEKLPEDAATDKFARAIKARFEQWRRSGEYDYETMLRMPEEELKARVLSSIEKGDLVEAATFAMMLQVR